MEISLAAGKDLWFERHVLYRDKLLFLGVVRTYRYSNAFASLFVEIWFNLRDDISKVESFTKACSVLATKALNFGLIKVLDKVSSQVQATAVFKNETTRHRSVTTTRRLEHCIPEKDKSLSLHIAQRD